MEKMYSRNRIYIKPDEQEKIKHFRVLLGGAGIGSIIAECALRMGFETITIIDGDKVEKIVSNLFTNALKHTSPGGVIRINAHVDDNMLEVSVFNSGKLMDEDRMQDVFKRYYQLADSQDSDQYGWGTGNRYGNCAECSGL